MRLVTWNLLAPELCGPPREGGRDYYARTRAHLGWHDRLPRIFARLRAIDADVACLQEVSKDHWLRDLRHGFERLGYEAAFAPRPEGRPDGVAVLARAPYRLLRVAPMDFGPGVDKAWLLARLEAPGGPVCVASVHLKWTVDGQLPMDHLGHALDAADREAPGLPAVVAGDLNVDAARHRAWAFVSKGRWAIAHGDDRRPTWAADGRAEKTDAIAHRNWSAVQPERYDDVSADPGLPSEAMPSDHLPLVATFARSS